MVPLFPMNEGAATLEESGLGSFTLAPPPLRVTMIDDAQVLRPRTKMAALSPITVKAHSKVNAGARCYGCAA